MSDKAPVQSNIGQKKQFLKRKSGAGIPTGRGETKKSYKYYVDNFEKKPEEKLQAFVAK